MEQSVWGEKTKTSPRPGEKAFIDSDGVIYGTDGKCRWAVEVPRWRAVDVLLPRMKKMAGLGGAAGALTMLLRLDEGPMAAFFAALPIMLGMVAAGAVLALLGHWVTGLSAGGRCCLLFTIDEQTVGCQQAEGRADREKVARAFAEWVGGQSQPSLRLQPIWNIDLHNVKDVRKCRERIRISGRFPTSRIYGEPGQLAFVLAWIRERCPQAEVR